VLSRNIASLLTVIILFTAFGHQPARAQSGHINAAGADSFTITDTKTGTTKTIPYADAAQVRKTGGGLSTRAWLILGAAATAAIIVGVTVIKPILCDGGAGC
jgi:hypothetical protein